jgi:hypothetical protein
MVNGHVDKAAWKFFEIPDDFHPTGCVQRRLAVEKVKLPMGGVDPELRNPPKVDPRAHARHPNYPARRRLSYKSVIAVMREELRPARQVGSDREDLYQRRPNRNLIRKIHSTPDNRPLRCPHSLALGSRADKRIAQRSGLQRSFRLFRGKRDLPATTR